MSTTKTTLILLIFILIWIPSVRSSQSNTDIVGKVVEIEPVALEVILPIYERVVVLFMNGVKENVMKFY
jgi:hypothetical protein